MRDFLYMRETRQLAGLSLDRCGYGASWWAPRESTLGPAGRPHALLDSDRLTLTVSMRMASAQARLKSFAVLLQYGVLCCQSFRIKVFGDLVLPGQRRDLFLVLPGRSATSWEFSFAYVHTADFSQTASFLKPHLFELHHHQQSSRGPGLSPAKDWRSLQPIACN